MPIEISTYAELQAIENDLSADYVIVNDIDGQGEPDFSPIGNYATSDPFTGTIDGQGHTISNLTIDEPNLDRCGFIAVTSGSSQISVKDLIFESPSITGESNTGAFVGRLGYTRIENCVVLGGSVSITGTSHCGGLVGEAFGNDSNPGTILNSYSSCTVEGAERIGGIVGYLHWRSDCFKCWSLGLVTATSHGGGGINGQSAGGGEVEDSFSDSTVGISSGGDGSYKTTAEMQDIATYTDTATEGLDDPWDMVLIGSHTTETWYIDDGSDYPRLSYELEDEVIELTADKGSYFVSGKEVTLLVSILLSAEKAGYVISGKDTKLLVESLLESGKGAYEIDGKGATLAYGIFLLAQKGSYEVTPRDIDLLRDYVIQTESGEYFLEGKNATFIFTRLGLADGVSIEYYTKYGVTVSSSKKYEVSVVHEIPYIVDVTVKPKIKEHGDF